MQRLTSVHGSFEARLLAARLQSEGLEPELRGMLDGPYGLTVGELSRVDVFVPEEQMADARLVLLADEVDAAFEHRATTSHRPRWRFWVVLVLVAAATFAPVARYFIR
jgi:hypothetical protein